MLVQPKSWLTTTGTTAPTQRIRLSAAHAEWNHIGIALAAMDQGIFADEGLPDVEIISFPATEDELLQREAEQVDLLASGVVDVAIDPRTTFLLDARSKGRPVSIVAARRRTHAFVLIGEKGMTSIEELRGATLLTTEAGGANDVMLRQVLKDSGLEPDEDVRIGYSGGPMHNSRAHSKEFREGHYGPAILAGTADAPRLVEAGYPVLADLRTRYPSRHDRVTAANADFAHERRDQLVSFLRGMIRSWRWVMDPANAGRFRELVAEAGFLAIERERESFDDLFDGWRTRGTSDLNLPRDGIELIVDETKRAGIIPPTFATDDVLDLEPLQEAHRQLGITV